MKIAHRTLPTVWLTVVALFTVASAAVFAVLWANSGGGIPLLTGGGYEVTFPVKNANNIVYYSDVREAGVAVGKVVGVDNSADHATLTIHLDSDVAPLHAGATVRIGQKSLIEESFVAVRDGTGPALPNGSVLAASSVRPSVNLDDVLNSLDPTTRTELGSSVRSLGRATSGTSPQVAGLFQGMGELGRGGATALGALARQSQQLQSLSANTTVLLDALDTQRGQVATLVDAGQRITAATADGRGDLEATMRQLPGVLHSTAVASDKLTELSGALAPVAHDVAEAAPTMTDALRQLPDVSRDLRATMPELDGTLRRAPDTLELLPRFGDDTRALAPPAGTLLSNLNPALEYLQPYGRDMAAFFTNFGSQASQGNADGNWARISLMFSEQSLRGYPVSTNIGPFNRSNAYPRPGGSPKPQPFTGTYPRVTRDGG